MIHCACETRPEKFLTLSRLISAFERAYYHLPTRPEWRERATWLSLRNSEVGAESARCVLVEFSAHFWASKSTFGAPLAFLESENVRFIKVWFLFHFCMRWNRQFSCSGSANGQVGVIFWWVLDSFFDGCGDLQMTPGAPWGPIGTPGSKKYIICSIRLSNDFFSEVKAPKITFRGVIGGENLKILKIFIFWFFNFLDRFYTFTCAPDLFTARGSGHRSRSTHFILPP